MKKFDLGIIGGGQLGMFICQAAKELSLTSVVYSNTEDFSAQRFCDHFIVGNYSNESINEFIESSDLFTIETENIPKTVLRKINRRKKLFPNSDIIEICQNRFEEKNFLNSIDNVSTAKFRLVKNFKDLEESLKFLGNQGILKSCKFGYDGKGQYFINKLNYREFEKFSFDEFIIEEVLDFKKEISVIICKTNQNFSIYPPVENLHKNSILRKTTYPAKINKRTSENAKNIALSISSKLGLVGILTVEMFVMKDNSILVNELAPRPHNSGHWSLDFCETSQFKNLILSIFDGKVKNPNPTQNCKMINIIGADYKKKEQLKKVYKFYDYFKGEIRPLRKMGHYTIKN